MDLLDIFSRRGTSETRVIGAHARGRIIEMKVLSRAAARRWIATPASSSAIRRRAVISSALPALLMPGSWPVSTSS
jgi:hypothetical protein